MSAFQICNKFDAMTSFDDVMTKNGFFMTFYFLSSETILIEISCGYTYHRIIGIPFSTHNGQGQRSRQDFSFYERFFVYLFICLAHIMVKVKVFLFF